MLLSTVRVPLRAVSASGVRQACNRRPVRTSIRRRLPKQEWSYFGIVLLSESDILDSQFFSSGGWPHVALYGPGRRPRRVRNARARLCAQWELGN